MGLISKKLRDSARGKDCTFQTPYCNSDPATTVLCHLPSEVKGTGNKSDDFIAAFGCSSCHEAIDQHRLSKDDERSYCFRALIRTWAIWVRDGLVFVAGIDPDKPKTRSGRKANFQSQKIPHGETKWPSKKLQSRPFARPEPERQSR